MRVELIRSADELRVVERDTIAGFVKSKAGLLTGRVLDYGCGQEPYRPIVEEVGGDYWPFDRATFPANVSRGDVGPDEADWPDLDAILMTQVIQYVPDPAELLGGFCDLLRGGDPGALVMTGPTTWPVVEPEDLHRFTTNGIAELLSDAGFRDVAAEDRWAIRASGMSFVVGWQAVAVA